jgi:hypothetical protein
MSSVMGSASIKVVKAGRTLGYIDFKEYLLFPRVQVVVKVYILGVVETVVIY